MCHSKKGNGSVVPTGCGHVCDWLFLLSACPAPGKGPMGSSCNRQGTLICQILTALKVGINLTQTTPWLSPRIYSEYNESLALKYVNSVSKYLQNASYFLTTE